MSDRKTLLAIGAHMDDCVFGLSGTMLLAARRGYRVVILNLIGDLRNWGPSKGRADDLVGEAAGISRGFGVETRFLDFASGRFDVGDRTKEAVAGAVMEIRPDIAFHLWPDDHHPDHVAAAAICHPALLLGGRILGREGFRAPRRLFAYDNGPRHTIGFVPDTFVDISEVWPDAVEWVGKFGSLLRNVPFDPTKIEVEQRTKEILSAYRGLACGTRYAEAFRSDGATASEIL